MDLDSEYFTEPKWPSSPWPVGKSQCCWFPKSEQTGFIEVMKGLPRHPVYVELGTFLGAGSTRVALETRDDLQALCFDDFTITADIIRNASKGNHHYLPENFKGSDFSKGVGDALKHCQNNLFSYQDRVKIFKMHTSHAIIDKLANSGVMPDCVLIDDHHERGPFIKRLFRCRYRWPDAWIICDDYCKSWPGVMEGVSEAFKRGWYHESESKMLGKRTIAFKRNR
tara:strand:+ start:331 stop:1005 length:675 start_codon:yes stop_codon:yes gene_type:complete